METLRGFANIPVETVEFLTLCPQQWKCSNCSILVPLLWRSIRNYNYNNNNNNIDKELNNLNTTNSSRLSSLIITCHHRFCALCLDTIFTGVALETKCPFDLTILKKKDLHEERLNIEKLMDKKIHCSHKARGCRKVLHLRELEDHLKSCLYGIIHCPLKCGEGITIKSLSEHMANSCPRRIISCEHCQEDLPMDTKDVHYKECPKRLINCRHCKEEIFYEQMKAHFDECPMKKRNCRFAVIGCEHSGTKDEVDEHERQWENHITTIINCIQLRSREPQQDNMKNRLGDLLVILKDLNIENETLKTNVEKLNTEIDFLNKQNKQLTQDMRKLETNYKNDFNKLKSTVNALKDEIKTLQELNEESEV